MFYIQNAELTVSSCTVSNSTGAYGGFLATADEVDIVLDNLVISTSTATSKGGLVYAYTTATPTVSSSIEFQNNA